APTYDFVMKLLSFGAMIEVLEPHSLRKMMKGRVSDMYELYKND
ncbi:MAG: WYL domain-containing protein, partial [Bacteroidales bacterium]|nr:WYL domain-containing protein [Bacteroidales bacterium]